MLSVTDLHKSFGALTILNGVSLSLDAGQTLALVGESGSGKSTLLHLIAGLDAPDRGQILLGGENIAGLSDAARAVVRRTRVGLVFQQFNLVQSLNVAHNIALQARLAGRHDPAHDAMLIARLGLDGLQARYPEELSGGQQQRVAIARALAGRPPLLLADEPTGNLDEATADRVMDLTLDLVRDLGMALVLVTHSPRLAERLGRVMTLHGGVLAP